MASTGTRLRWASIRPLIRCRLPGPQLAAHTASCPVIAASPAAAKAAASSCRTCCQAMSPSRRRASVCRTSVLDQAPPGTHQGFDGRNGPVTGVVRNIAGLLITDPAGAKP